MADERACDVVRRCVVREVGNEPTAIARWQAYVAASSAATVYHDVAWRQIFGEALGYRSYLLMAEDESGRVCGILPLYRVPSLLGKPRLVAVPFRDRGGIVCEHDAAFVALVEAARKIMRRCDAACVEMKSIDPYTASAIEATGLIRVDHWQHSRVDLTGLTEASLAKALGAKMRIVRQALRSQLSFTDRTRDLDAVDVWYGIYEVSQRSLGVPPFPKSFFRRMIELLAPKDALNLFVVATTEGTPLAATLVLHDAQSSIYAYSASLPGERHLRPNDLMLYRLYLWLIERGRTRFDFGADSPGQEGLLRFKRKWLAKQTPIPFYYLGVGDPAATDNSAARFDLARKMVRLAPLPISRRLLSPFVRYFG